eukprot:14086281-Alexandrium_andersonii.AAC.1
MEVIFPSPPPPVGGRVAAVGSNPQGNRDVARWPGRRPHPIHAPARPCASVVQGRQPRRYWHGDRKGG